jgi:uncharacterized protein (TIGR02594 family)
MTAWLQLAHQEMGVEEIDGSESNPRVMEYFATCGGTWVKDDGTPWCGAFTGYVLATSGQKIATEPLRARSWLAWGTPLDKPVAGCVVVLRRGKDPQQGHVGFYVQSNKDGSSIYVLGGNQGDRVSIQRFNAANVLGYRMPAGAANPKPEDSRTIAESNVVAGTGAATAAGGVAYQSVPNIPSPPSMPEVGEWQVFATGIKSFGLFAIESWPWIMIATGLYLVMSGKAIAWFRKQDALTGKNWITD